MKKVALVLFILGSFSVTAATDFDSKNRMRCYQPGSDTLILHKQIGSIRNLSVAGDGVFATMACNEESRSHLVCTYEVKSFWGQKKKTLTLDLTTVESIYNLDGTLRNYILDGDINGELITCTQDAD